jgi:hypothetical protein
MALVLLGLWVSAAQVAGQSDGTPAHAAAEPGPAAQPRGIEAAKPGDVLSVAGMEVTVKELDILPYLDNEYSRRFVFDKYENPKLTELRSQYELNEVIAPGKDEFEKQVLLMCWVRKQIRGGNPGSLGGLRNALEILERTKNGQRFFCVQCGSVFVSAAASTGWVSRSLALRRPDNIGGSSSEHTSTEIWSNQYRKWVMFDPTFALYVEKGGIPLSAYELRQEWFYKDAKDLVFVDCRAGRHYKKADVRRPYPAQLFAFIGYVPNTNFMDAGADWAGMFITKSNDRVCDGTDWHQRDCPKEPAVEPYFPINQAALTLVPQGAALHVTIRTLTPNFKEFQIRTDDGEWRTSPDGFAWTLHVGLNKLEARSINKFDVPGPISTVELNVRK